MTPGNVELKAKVAASGMPSGGEEGNLSWRGFEHAFASPETSIAPTSIGWLPPLGYPNRRQPGPQSRHILNNHYGLPKVKEILEYIAV